MGSKMNQEIVDASIQGVKKHQKKMRQERQRAANNAARMIVKAVEAETGQSLSLELCIKIVGIVAEAQQ